jgi:hypothetical protein
MGFAAMQFGVKQKDAGLVTEAIESFSKSLAAGGFDDLNHLSTFRDVDLATVFPGQLPPPKSTFRTPADCMAPGKTFAQCSLAGLCSTQSRFGNVVPELSRDEIASFYNKKSMASVAQVTKAQLKAYYSKHSPEKLGTIAAALKHFKGREGELVEQLETKYKKHVPFSHDYCDESNIRITLSDAEIKAKHLSMDHFEQATTVLAGKFNEYPAFVVTDRCASQPAGW